MAKNDGELVSKAEFARRIGCTRGNVNQAIKAGRISVVVGRGKKVHINWDKEMPKFVRTSQSNVVKKKWLPKIADDDFEFGEEVTGKNAIRNPKKKRKIIRSKSGTLSVTEAHDQLTVAKAQKAMLEYEIQAGKYVELALVLNTFEDIASNIQTTILSIPDRIAPMCEGLTHNEIHVILTRELKHCLTALAVNVQDKVQPDKDK